MDFKLILLNYHLNVSKIINQCTLVIMQAHLTHWQTILKTQENNVKMLLIMLKVLKKINKKKKEDFG